LARGRERGRYIELFHKESYKLQAQTVGRGGEEGLFNVCYSKERDGSSVVTNCCYCAKEENNAVLCTRGLQWRGRKAMKGFVQERE